MYRNKKGFTLIELLVVIAIIAILAAILFPVLAAAKAKANEAKCISGMKQIGACIQMYVDDNGNRFPIYLGSPVHPRNSKQSGWVYATLKYSKAKGLCVCPAAPRSTAAGDWDSIQAAGPTSYWINSFTNLGCNTIGVPPQFASRIKPPALYSKMVYPKTTVYCMDSYISAGGGQTAACPPWGWCMLNEGDEGARMYYEILERHPAGYTVLFLDWHVATLKGAYAFKTNVRGTAGTCPPEVVNSAARGAKFADFRERGDGSNPWWRGD